MTPELIAQAASALVEAGCSGHYIAPLRETYEQLTIEDAYAIQRVNTGRRVAESSVDARVGGRWRIAMLARDSSRFVVGGQYREIVRPTRLVFTWWTSPEEEAANLSVVTLVLEPDGTGCIATIVHEMSAEWQDWIPQTSRGWASMLGQIDGHLTS